MNFIKKIVNNDYVFSVVAKILGLFFGIISSILYSRHFGTALTGDASVIVSYSDMIMLVLCLGIYQGYPYFKKKNASPNLYKQYIDLIFGVFLLYLLVSLLLIKFFYQNVLILMILILVPLMFATKELNYVVLIENPKTRNASAIMLSLFEVILILFFFFAFSPDIVTICVFLIVKELANFVVAVAKLRVNIFTIRPTLNGAIEYIRFGFVPMLTVILMEVNYKSDVMMLDYFDVEKSRIGIYSLAVGLSNKVWLIPDALKDMLLSKLAGGRGKEEVCKINRVSIFLSVICVAFLCLFGKPLIDILYGNDFSDAYLVITILVTGSIGMVFYKMIYSFNVVEGKKNINLLFLGIAAVSNIVLNILFIPLWGINGAAFTSTLSYTICGLIFALYFCIKTKTSFLELILLKKQDFGFLKSFFRKDKK